MKKLLLFGLFLALAASAQTVVETMTVKGVKNSVDYDETDSKLQLTNDSESPGNNVFYGTNGSGVRGWYTPSGSGHGDGANCAAGEIPLGVDASGAVQGCYEPTEADITDLDHTATALSAGVLDATTEIAGALCGTNEILEDQGGSWACISTPGGGGSVTQSSTVILEGTASSTGNNLAGVGDTEIDISWDATTNDTGEVTSFTNGDTEIQIANAGQIRLHTAVAVIDAGLNNRQTYGLSLNHLNSSDVLQYQYWLDSFYVRDDANDYDSGLGAGQLEINVAAGDKLQIEVEILDEQTNSGTVNASTTYSTVRVEKITY